ncbi:MAG: 2Fe-2S iron-sulfur cluster-binding protein, partial [Cyanobacteria bacterium J06648_11]
MTDTYTIQIHDRQRDRHYTVQVPSDRYILHAAEDRGIELPFACRNGACTTCAVRLTSGEVYQPEAMGISKELRQEGYALLCVCYPRSDASLEDVAIARHLHRVMAISLAILDYT